MEKPEPKVIRVLLEKGEHSATAVLNDWGSGITIKSIIWSGSPPLHDHDNSFETVADAVAAANRLWLKVLS